MILAEITLRRKWCARAMNYLEVYLLSRADLIHTAEGARRRSRAATSIAASSPLHQPPARPQMCWRPPRLHPPARRTPSAVAAHIHRCCSSPLPVCSPHALCRRRSHPPLLSSPLPACSPHALCRRCYSHPPLCSSPLPVVSLRLPHDAPAHPSLSAAARFAALHEDQTGGPP